MHTISQTSTEHFRPLPIAPFHHHLGRTIGNRSLTVIDALQDCLRQESASSATGVHR